MNFDLFENNWITPSKENEPKGTIEINENGEHNVKKYAKANVAVPQPNGKIVLDQNGTDIDIAQYASADVTVPTAELDSKAITANGTYEASDDNLDGYDEVTVNVNTDPEKGFVFGDYGSDGYPTTARFVGNWTEIPAHFMQLQDAALDGVQTGFADTNFTKNINKVVIPNGVTSVGANGFRAFLMKELDIPETCGSFGDDAFRNCVNLRKLTMRCGTATRWHYCFMFCLFETIVFTNNTPKLNDLLTNTKPTLQTVDFSNNTEVCQLSNTNKFPHADGCVIKVPQALLAEWQEETNWIDLPTDLSVSGYVVWEGV